MNLTKLSLLATLLISPCTFASWISADDFSVGDSVGNIGFLSLSTQFKGYNTTEVNTSPTVITKDPYPSSNGYFEHQHFGSGLYIERLFLHEQFGEPIGTNPYFIALDINFNRQNVTSFSMKTETGSGSPLVLLAYDNNGAFLKSFVLSTPVTRVGMAYLSEFKIDFDRYVGSVKIGSTSDVAYVYAINATAPEPSSLALFGVASAALLWSRRNQANRKNSLKP